MTGPVVSQALYRHSTGGYEREISDWYVEPAWCWDVLFDLVDMSGTVLDPSCGGGTGLEWCRARGVHAIGSDIVDRGAGACVADFLAPDYPWTADNVICNPPYKLTVDFAHKALAVTRRRVALLVPLPFLCSQRRYPLFRDTPVSHVIVLSKRPSMPPGGRGIRASGGKEDFCWIVWTLGHEGAPALLWGKP